MVKLQQQKIHNNGNSFFFLQKNCGLHPECSTVKFTQKDHLFVTLDRLYKPLFDFDNDYMASKWLSKPWLDIWRPKLTSKKIGKGPKLGVQSGEQVVHRSEQYCTYICGFIDSAASSCFLTSNAYWIEMRTLESWELLKLQATAVSNYKKALNENNYRIKM